MAKPDVTISAPTALVVGRPYAIDIDVQCDKATKVEFVEATLGGEQGWAIGSGKSRVAHAVKYPQLAVRLMHEGVLAEGPTRFTARFTLPLGTPPTHAVRPAYARMRLRIHISLPWRIDGRYHYDFVVRLPPPAHVERTPVVLRSTPSDARPDKPRIEIGLASRRLIVGERLVGTCAVFHLDDDKPRDVELSLVPMFELMGRGRTRERRADPFTFTLTLPPGSAGSGVPFEIPLPLAMIPSFETVTHTLAWWLVARTGSLFSTKVDAAIPLEIVDASAADTTPELTRPPRLGDERVATTFATFAAAHGWRGADPDGDEVDGQFAIERELGDAVARVGYDYRGEAGTFLVSSVQVPSLGLGLEVTRGSSLRHVFFRDVEIDIAAWDRAHLVDARTPDQAIPVLRAIVPILMRCAAPGTLVRWDDDELVFERAVANVEADVLAAIAADLERLAQAVADAAPAITPPPDVTVDLEAWRALARRYGARLTVGDLSLAGKLEGLPVEVGMSWDLERRPRAVQVAVGDPEIAGELLRAHDLALPRPAADALASNQTGAFVELVTSWPADFVDLRVYNGVAAASLSLPASPSPKVDPQRVRELVEALRAVLGALEPGAGPYR